MPALGSPFARGTRLAWPVLVAGLCLAPAPAAAQTRNILVSLPNYTGPVVLTRGHSRCR